MQNATLFIKNCKIEAFRLSERAILGRGGGVSLLDTKPYSDL